MTPEESDKLRGPFPPESIGHRPVVTCKACSDSQDRVCDKKTHVKKECRECGNYLTSAHTHLDFVGHAFVRERLLDVDTEWNWEPMATDDVGRPAFDSNGGMWIYLTVRGTRRIGYGDADGKKGPKAVKEAIGDALRNAGQSFGIALDMWKKESKAAAQASEADHVEPERPITLEDRIKTLRSQCIVIWKTRGGTAVQLADDFAQWSSTADEPKGRDFNAETDPNLLYQYQRYLQKQAAS